MHCFTYSIEDVARVALANLPRAQLSTRQPRVIEVKLDVYGKRQTAKMKLLPFLFSCVYSGVKLFESAIKSRRSYSIFVCFIYGLEEKNSKAEVMSSAGVPLTSYLTSLLLSSFLLIRK